MDKAINLELDYRQSERLERAAEQLGRSPADTVGLLLEEALRERGFPLIEYRETIVGREAYLRGTRLKVWMLVDIARGVDQDVGKVSESLGIPSELVTAALEYASAYPREIDEAIAANDREPEELRRLIPNLQVLEIDAPAS